MVVELFSGQDRGGYIAGRRGGRRRRGHRQPTRPAHLDHAGELARTGRRGVGAHRGAPAGGAATRRGALARRQRVGQRACATTGSAATRTRWPQPSGPPRTRAGSAQSIWVLAELIEAAVRSGQTERAADPLAQLAELAQAAGTDWALGTHARGAALLAEGAAAERLYREAIERLSRIHMRGSQTLARAHLLYGEWLRREHRRVDAREQLRVAHTMLADMGAEAFAERARRELLATGETVRKRTRRDARRADPTGGAGRAPGRRRADEPRDRRPALPQPAHRRVAPAQGVRQARDQLPQGAPLGAVRHRRKRRTRIAANAPRRSWGLLRADLRGFCVRRKMRQMPQATAFRAA